MKSAEPNLPVEIMLECSPNEKHACIDSLRQLRRMIDQSVASYEGVGDLRLKRLCARHLLATVGLYEYRLMALGLSSRGFTDRNSIAYIGPLGVIRDKDSPRYAEARCNDFSAMALIEVQFARSSHLKNRVVAEICGPQPMSWPLFPVLVDFSHEVDESGHHGFDVRRMTSEVHMEVSKALGVKPLSVNFARHNVVSWCHGSVGDVALASAMGHTVGGVSGTWRYSTLGVACSNEVSLAVAQRLADERIRPIKQQPVRDATGSLAVALPRRSEGNGTEKPARPSVAPLPSPKVERGYDASISLYRNLLQDLRLDLSPQAAVGAAIFMTIMDGSARESLLQTVLHGLGADSFRGLTLRRRWRRPLDGLPQVVAVALTNTAALYWYRAISIEDSVVPAIATKAVPVLSQDKPPFSVSRCLNAFLKEAGGNLPLRSLRLVDIEQVSALHNFIAGCPPWMITEAGQVSFSDTTFASNRPPDRDSLFMEMRARVEKWWASDGRSDKIEELIHGCREDGNLSDANSLLANFYAELRDISSKKFRSLPQQQAVRQLCEQYRSRADRLWRDSSAAHLAIEWIGHRLTSGEFPAVDRVEKDVSAIFRNGLFSAEYWQDLQLATPSELTKMFGDAIDKPTQQPEKDRIRTWVSQLRDIGTGTYFAEGFDIGDSARDSAALMGSARCRVVTYTEFDTLYQALSAGDHERALMVRVILGMGFWLGLRPGEVVALSIRDVRVLTRTLVLNIHGSKTSAARRRVVASLLAPAEFTKDLCALLNLRVQACSGLSREQVGRAPLFALGGDDSQACYTALITPLIALLKSVFGREITYYHLRHACLNYSLLRAEAASDDSFRRSLPECEHEMFTAHQLARFLKVISTSEYVSSPDGAQATRLIGIAKLVGHAGMATMFRAYCHVAYLIIGHRLRSIEESRVGVGKVGRTLKSLLSGRRSSRTLAKIPSDRSGLVNYLWGLRESDR